MERLTNERFAEIIRDKELCEFCEDCGNDEVCLNCEKVNPATVGELRSFWKKLSALVKARDEGRVVVLAVDTNVFIVQDNHIYQFRVYDYSLVAKNDGNTRFLAVCEECDEIDDLDFWTDDIGKTVFLTRTEAEAALSCQQCRESGAEKVCEDKRTGYVCPNKAALGGGEA